MPDIFTSFLALSLYLLIFSFGRAPRDFSRELLFYGIASLCFLSLLIHAANPLIALGVLGACGLLGFWKKLVLPTQLVMAAMLVLVMFGGMSRRSSSYLRSTPVFLVNRLVASGLLTRLLGEHCRDYSYELCPYQKELSGYTPTQYLWDPASPLNKNRLLAAAPSESWRMIKDVWRYYPLPLALDILRGWGRQFFQIESGEGLNAYAPSAPVTAFLRKYNPSEGKIFAGSLQERGRLQPVVNRFNPVQVPLTQLALALLALLALREIYRRYFGFSSFIFIFLLMNAFVCSTFSVPTGRYQGRVAWLALCGAFLAAAKIWERRAKGDEESA
jgi:hypothetical protein